jgi:cytochrome c oxidase cbb3-type subunit 3
MLRIAVFTVLAALAAASVAAQAPPRTGGPGAAAGAAGGQRGRGQGASPASQTPPAPASPQTFSAEQINAGRSVFSGQCGFCHGRDAAGGEGGTDLTRSTLVAQDVAGDRIGAVVRSGRPDKGMPPFTLSAPDLAAIVAFLHDQQANQRLQQGGRRTVDVADLQTGNAEAGRTYFEASCTKCHSATGDFKGLASRLRGLQLLQRMLYPPSAGGRGTPPKVTVTPRSGPAVTGQLVYRDEFTIALTDAQGWNRSWPTSQVAIVVDDPLAAHIEQLGKYTDADMHNVLAYLQTLK